MIFTFMNTCRNQSHKRPVCYFYIITLGNAYTGFNMISSLGAYISAASAILFVFILVHAFVAGRKAEANYWGDGATTLEWTVSSPPPFHSFEEPPVITGGPSLRPAPAE